MQEIIDSPYNVGDYAARLFQEGVRTVIRYYNIKNSSTFLSKCLTAAEYGKLVAAGLDLAVVFEQRGGAGGAIDDFGNGKGTRDAKRALELAGTVGQPKDSAIYFAVDHDFARPAELAQIEHYFQEVNAALNGHFRVGVYGSGAVCSHLKAGGLATLFWLPASMGWTGSKAFLASQQWTLFQKFQGLRGPFGNFDYDGNLANPAFADFGQFGAAPAAPVRRPEDAVAVFEVAARSGLRVRGGAGAQFDVVQSLPLGAVVHGLGTEADWVQVDVNGDGVADGYMARQFLKPLSGGLPLPAPSTAPTTPYAVAQAELALGVKETPGRQDNPRIVLYHSTTKGGEAPDETAWCSSFVNYCVEKAGMQGTDSKWARSWHDSGWGHDVTSNPQPGDIVVWSRKSPSVDGGHVGFFVGQDGKDRIRVLGGNQGNRVCITSYPVDGSVGQTKYKLLSIRR
ncbi:TIGR02594 family protein [Sphingomonas sp. NFR04]|uniref:TIGR02594 family protein n=1 Tax=Sphingomonas sp. NFR04 TaxID=1566283 RepID=UPI0008EE61E0|nr:TIGR02594 family protein [Sphingomonas sp. NFR04]SFJ88407.1 TIGR02594 family protein [Sphingomonas sp. NFR04]